MPTWLLGWSADPGTVLLLGIVLWLDGWRRRPDGAILLVRAGLGPWRVRTPWAELGPFALVAWGSPIVMPLLLTTPVPPLAGQPRWAADFDVAVARGRRRLRRVRVGVAVLRVLGALLLAWIVFGIPLVTSRFGVDGLIRGIASAFVFATLLATVAVLELRVLGMRWWPSMRRAAHLISPFSAPQAAEVVATVALEDVAPIVRAAVLLGRARFLAWIRPLAYDVLYHRTDVGNGEGLAAATLASELPRPILERATGAEPVGSDSAARFCPRCARTYRDDVAACSECGDLSLISRR